MPSSRKQTHYSGSRPIASSFITSAKDAPQQPDCLSCSSTSHSLLYCPKFKAQAVEDRFSFVRSKRLCFNCLRNNHQSDKSNSFNRCCACQGKHHTLLHREQSTVVASPATHDGDNLTNQSDEVPVVTSNAAIQLKSNILLMTCQVIALSPDGQTTQARVLLDTGSTTSFISEHLANSLNLRRSSQLIRISGIAGSSPESTSHAVVNLSLSAKFSSEKLNLSAIVLPKVTHDLPVFPVPFRDSWNHLKGI